MTEKRKFEITEKERVARAARVARYLKDEGFLLIEFHEWRNFIVITAAPCTALDSTALSADDSQPAFGFGTATTSGIGTQEGVP